MHEMKKLEDIPKKVVFEVPKGYFDRLPGIIQARVADTKQEPAWAPFLRYGLKYAMPVLAIVVAALLYRTSGAQSTEQLLTSIDSAELVAYLGDTDISLDDLLEGIPLDNEEAASIQESSMNEIIVNEADLDSLTSEFEINYF